MNKTLTICGARVAITLLGLSELQSAILTSTEPGYTYNEYLGGSVSISGSKAVCGVSKPHSGPGYASLFANIDTAGGVITRDAQLVSYDAATNANQGSAVGISGTTVISGAPLDVIGGHIQGSAYIFRNTTLNTVILGGRLTASDGGDGGGMFGGAVAVSGPIAVVGAPGDGDWVSGQGAAYIFRGVDSMNGGIHIEDVKLIASDAFGGNALGSSVGISGTRAIAGAPFSPGNGGQGNGGSAYIFSNLDTEIGTNTQSLKLVASDSAAGDQLGVSVGIAGTIAICGAPADNIGANSDQGSAYVFRNLNAGGVVIQNAKLVASDGATEDFFGSSVGISGTTGIVGAPRDDIGTNGDQGSAYLFLNLNTGSGSKEHDVKLTASAGEVNEGFGVSVGVDGDHFIVGVDVFGWANKAYAGSVGSVTTFDPGGLDRAISGISFASKRDWIIGQTTGSNQVTLSAGDSADVTASGKAVFIGKNAGSDNNKLVIAGSLTANEIYVGSSEGNSGNTLQLEGDAAFTASSLRVADGNSVKIAGSYSNIAGLLTYLDGTPLEVRNDGVWEVVNAGNHSSLISMNESGGYTMIQAPVSSAFPEIGIEYPEGFGLSSGLGVVNFSPTAVNGSTSLEFIVRNAGGEGLTGIVASILDPDTLFTLQTMPPSSLGEGDSAAFRVRFAPTTLGAKLATLSIASSDTDQNPFIISLMGTGVTAREAFDNVIAANSSLTGDDALPNAIPYDDGVENLLKYAFNMNLGGWDVSVMAPGTGTGGLPAVGLAEAPSGSVLRVEFVRRKGSGLTYTPKVSGNLDSFDPMTGAVTVVSIDDNWERVTAEQPCDPATTPRCFALVEVALP